MNNYKHLYEVSEIWRNGPVGTRRNTAWGSDGRGEGFARGRANAAGAAERSPMWFLVIVLLNIVPGVEKITVLNTFATSEECQSERNRIAFEMAAAYPNDRDFVSACRLNSKHGS